MRLTPWPRRGTRRCHGSLRNRSVGDAGHEYPRADRTVATRTRATDPDRLAKPVRGRVLTYSACLGGSSLMSGPAQIAATFAEKAVQGATPRADQPPASRKVR